MGLPVGVHTTEDLDPGDRRHAGHGRPSPTRSGAARAGRAGGQHSDRAPKPGSYQVTHARPAACVVTPRRANRSRTGQPRHRWGAGPDPPGNITTPSSLWGAVVLETSQPQVGKAWTDDGERTEKRTLKWRGHQEVRRVPIPPELVAILRQHLDTYGAAPDGRLFRTSTGGHVTATAYYRAWEAARRYGLTPEAVGSPLAGQPHDLHHGGVTLRLNAGVPAPEVARRAGHGVDVLLKIYAGCIDGEEEVANRRIEDALGDEMTGGYWEWIPGGATPPPQSDRSPFTPVPPTATVSAIRATVSHGTGSIGR